VGDQFIWVLQKQAENLKGLFLELYPSSAAAQLSRPQAHVKDPEMNFLPA
jgi:hypothetical protein